MAETNWGADGAPTGNVYLDTLIMGGAWVETLGTGVTLTWSTANSGFFTTHYFSDQPSWTTTQTQALRDALQAWANVADITFVESTQDDGDLDLRFIRITTDQMDFWVGENVSGSAEPPISPNSKPLTAVFADDRMSFTDGLFPGGLGFRTLVHEIGHMLGLAHPHPDSEGDPAFPGVVESSDLGDYGLNQSLFTVMSYNRTSIGTSTVFVATGNSRGPSAFDIAAIQALYGANTSFAAGNDIYVLPSDNSAGTGWTTIWDTAGTDRIDGTDSTVSLIIDLRPAPLTGPHAGGYASFRFGVFGGFTIANGVLIENAIGGSTHDILYGNEGANSINGGTGGDDLVYGYGGNDTIVTATGSDRIYGGGGNDSIATGNGGSDRASGSAGNDTLSADGDAATLSGGVGNDFMTGTSLGADLLNGDANDDVIDARGGNDTVDGGAGADTVLGGAGNDELFGDSGTDLMYGEDDDDTLYGWSASDTLFGGGGNDVVLGHSGNDSIAGGKGEDNISGGPGADTATGDENDDYMQGGDNNDSLLGGEGNDRLFGDAGADRLRGEAGADTVDGGAENDFVWGGTEDDLLLGGNGNDYLSGDGDDDTLQGGGGNDRQFGGYGNDSVEGGEGDDYVSGGFDNDTLSGGAGADTLAGGAGRDTFVFASIEDFLFGTPDVMLDFNPSSRSGDVMDFRLVDANTRLDGDQSFAFYATRPETVGIATLWLEADRDGLATLFGEVSGDGIADFAIGLGRVRPLTEAVFLL